MLSDLENVECRMLSVELPNGRNGASKNQHSTLNIQHSLNHSTFKKSFNTQHSTLVPVEHRSKRPLTIEELFGFILDTQLSDHLEIIIAALHAEPSVLHADKGNAGNQ